jgi:hypothetical protein
MQTDGKTGANDENGLAFIRRWLALPFVIVGGIAAIITGQFSSLAVAEGMGLTVVMTLCTATIWWPLRRFPIAWIATASVLIIHLFLVFAIPWPHQERASKIIILIFVIDVLGVIVISDWLEKRTRASRQIAP